MTAYFTDSMSDEFKKAMEEAMKDLDDEGEKPKKKRAVTKTAPHRTQRKNPKSGSRKK